ncbi:DedA family protein [Corynebacterium heidelbergense]|uniref:Alkaline phosphatase n=1 Tax=Corynebacterium heidelbergense TaxID=2055947 RepID=A0A364V7F4_9CORY|nr:VTT domain-containing protein [Corynebacterium heidelbergense]RAV32572.1 alkaline phosphatase [Corynebacterium heidelbergense]
MSFLDHLHQLTDPEALLQGFGPWVLVGLAVIVFIESGVLFPFLPGDSLLVTAAILRDALETNVWAIIAVAIAAAVLGDQVGFFLGRRFGRRLFKPNARILKLRHLEEAEEFFAKHGPVALVLGRFVPIVRTYVPLAAGTAAMSYRRFVVWNVSGAVLWVLSMVAIGVLLGGIPGIAHSIDLIMLVVIGMSVLPMIIAGVQRHRKQKRLDRTPSA